MIVEDKSTATASPCLSPTATIRHVCHASPPTPLPAAQLGREEPAMSMDANGKIIWAKHSEVQQANLKAMVDTEIKDGERLPLAVKDMGSCEIYPQTIQHNPNGR